MLVPYVIVWNLASEIFKKIFPLKDYADFSILNKGSHPLLVKTLTLGKWQKTYQNLLNSLKGYILVELALQVAYIYEFYRLQLL